MWFGDRDHDGWDLRLNESFAEWASHFANTTPPVSTMRDTFANQRKGWAYRQDQLPTTHPIAADMVDLEAVYVNFDGITYAKGASALRQLVAFVGEEDFLRDCAPTSRSTPESQLCTTPANDLLTALADASGGPHTGPNGGLQTWGQRVLRAEISPARTVPWARWQFCRARQPCPKVWNRRCATTASRSACTSCAKAPSSGLIRWRSM